MNCAEHVFVTLSLLTVLSSAFAKEINATITNNGTTDPSDTPILPKKSVFEGHLLLNLCIIILVILIIFGLLFFMRYMRSERKGAIKRYARLNKADDDEDIELSIYEKT